MSLLDDLDDLDAPSPDPQDWTPRTYPEAISKAVRMAEVSLMRMDKEAREKGWKLVGACGTGINVWLRPDGKFVAHYPNQEVEL